MSQSEKHTKTQCLKIKKKVSFCSKQCERSELCFLRFKTLLTLHSEAVSKQKMRHFLVIFKHCENTERNPHFLCKYVVYFPGSATFVLLLPILQHYGRLESNWIPAFFSRFSIVIGNTNYRNSFSFWLRKGRSRSWYAEVLKSSSSMSVTVCATIPKSLSSKM